MKAVDSEPPFDSHPGHNHTLMDPGPMRDCPGCSWEARKRRDLNRLEEG